MRVQVTVTLRLTEGRKNPYLDDEDLSRLLAEGMDDHLVGTEILIEDDGADSPSNQFLTYEITGVKR